MAKIYKTVFCVLAAAVCIMILSIRPQAAETTSGYTVIGNGSGSSGENAVAEIINCVVNNREKKHPLYVALNEDDADAEKQNTEQGGNQRQSSDPGSSDSGIYSFEGRQYRKSASYGTHRLTGYSQGESGSVMTYSGKAARPAHTAAAPSDIPIDTVLIIEGVKGPYASRYNGVYVVEDRGGAVLEAEGIIDLFFASDREAADVTECGWNYADIWIAEAV